MRIEYVSPWADIDPENSNIDVHVHLDDGRVYSLLIATPKNIYRCMENDAIAYFFATPPPVFVSQLTEANVKRAVIALVTEDDGRYLHTYGVLQS
jgi:hypothetical protein